LPWPGQDEAQVRRRVEEALTKIRAGADFVETAKQYADNPSVGADLLTVHRASWRPRSSRSVQSAAGGVSERSDYGGFI